MNQKNKIDIFVERLKKLNINVKLAGNYPYIYLISVNGNTVKEKYMSDHAFCIGFSPIRINHDYKFNDLSKIFKIIRKYK